MRQAVISATGLWTPPEAISNDELVVAFNEYARRHNEVHAAEIAAGTRDAVNPSSSAFIEKASGIRARYVVEKAHILDPDVMCPRLPERPDDVISLQAEMAVAAARAALASAGRSGADVDAVLCACSNMQRAYPAMAVEVQDAIGCRGFGFDMNVACSSATFAIQTAADMIRTGSADRILVVNPEICSGHLNFRDRDSHFIFGDVATAILLEAGDVAPPGQGWVIEGTRLRTLFSNNIRNNAGFLNRLSPEGIGQPDKLFVQEGRKVFREVVPWVADLITRHLADSGIAPDDLARIWLHQANLNMNVLIAKRVFGRDPVPEEAPVILDEFANTSSAGSVVAFHRHSADLPAGALGLLCSFGAGYSAGSVILRKRG